jgi:putative Holliday junction resolvase
MPGMHDALPAAFHIAHKHRPHFIISLLMNSTPEKLQGTVLAFDFGEKRIGVAIGEHLLGIAHPLTTIQSEANDERFRVIGELIDQWQPVQLVVGLPLSLEGEEHALTLLCRKFARRLNGRFNLPVAMVDERLSSAEASQTLKEIGIGGRRQKPMLDQVAAQHILQSYFDNLNHHDIA